MSDTVAGYVHATTPLEDTVQYTAAEMDAKMAHDEFRIAEAAYQKARLERKRAILALGDYGPRPLAALLGFASPSTALKLLRSLKD